MPGLARSTLSVAASSLRATGTVLRVGDPEQLTSPRAEFVLADEYGEGDAGAIGVLKLLGELARFEHRLGGDPGRTQLAGERQGGRTQRILQQTHQHLDGALRGADQSRLAQLPEQTSGPDGDAHTGQARARVVGGEILVTPSRTDAADLRMRIERRLVDGAGVVVEPARDGEIEHHTMAGHAELRHAGEDLGKLLCPCPHERSAGGKTLRQCTQHRLRRFVTRAALHGPGEQGLGRGSGEPRGAQLGEELIPRLLVELIEGSQRRRLGRRLDQAGDASTLRILR